MLKKFLTKLKGKNLTNLIYLTSGYLRGYLMFRQPCCVLGKTTINQKKQVRLDPYAKLWPGVKISTTRSGRVSIGERTSIGDNTQIHAAGMVIIGSDCMVSWDVTIMDHDYHSGKTEPVYIHSDAWIGCKAIILKGVSVGRGAVVGAGAVVTKNVPAGRVAVGNPAKLLER